MKPKTPMTERQRLTLWTIRNWIEDHAVPPTVRELAASLGVRSTNTIAGYLKGLEHKGYIERVPGQMRNVRLVER